VLTVDKDNTLHPTRGDTVTKTNYTPTMEVT